MNATRREFLQKGVGAMLGGVLAVTTTGVATAQPLEGREAQERSGSSGRGEGKPGAVDKLGQGPGRGANVRRMLDERQFGQRDNHKRPAFTQECGAELREEIPKLKEAARNRGRAIGR